MANGYVIADPDITITDSRPSDPWDDVRKAVAIAKEIKDAFGQDAGVNFLINRGIDIGAPVKAEIPVTKESAIQNDVLERVGVVMAGFGDKWVTREMITRKDCRMSAAQRNKALDTLIEAGLVEYRFHGKRGAVEFHCVQDHVPALLN